MKKLFILIVLLVGSSQLSYATTTIKIWKTTLNDKGIIKHLLQRSLEITKKEYGDYEFIASSEMEQDRALRELAHNKLNVAHFVATKERESQAIAIRIPIMQGLLGYRVCLINEENQYKFSGVTNQQQWKEKKLLIGQHQNWPDTTILKDNGFDVMTTYKTALLFQQLAKNRFDCFARGLGEINEEQQSYEALDLTVEKNIILHYTFPQFFFVNPANPKLAERLQLGLTRLQENGEKDEIFDSYYLALIEQLNFEKRVFIELHNSTLSQQTIDALQAPTTRFKKVYLSD